jgi:hypothetical protein
MAKITFEDAYEQRDKPKGGKAPGGISKEPEAKNRNDTEGLPQHHHAMRSPGRPRIENTRSTLTATKPWLAEGMSRRTWYRRQKERRDEC